MQNPQTRRGIDEALLIERYPLTHAYLSQFRDVLVRRAAYRRYQQDAAFYSMYNVGPYTIAPIKVVWRRMDRHMQAAVVHQRDVPGAGLRPVIPQETCVLIPVDTLDEAHYLCALLNSDPIDALLRAFSVAGGKGFGSPSILHSLGLRRFDPSDPRHRQLALWKAEFSGR